MIYKNIRSPKKWIALPIFGFYGPEGGIYTEYLNKILQSHSEKVTENIKYPKTKKNNRRPRGWHVK